MKKIFNCGVCEKDFPMDELIGPYAGGPFGWYCKTCRKTIDKYLEGRKKHKERFDNIMKKRKIKPPFVRNCKCLQ